MRLSQSGILTALSAFRTAAYANQVGGFQAGLRDLGNIEGTDAIRYY
jgi:hypothetical protein